MGFDAICRDIKSLKIQGAINVAKSGADALFDYSKKMKAKDALDSLDLLKKASETLVATRATEPALRNMVSFFIDDLPADSLKNFNREIERRHKAIKAHFDDAEKKIIEYGARKIKPGSIVFTHCHSSTVCNILKEAKRRGITFEVHNTETRPLYQGRKTAIELVKAGISVTHYVDSAARHALKKSD